MGAKYNLFLIACLLSRAPQVLTTLLVFALSNGLLGILFYMDDSIQEVTDFRCSHVHTIVAFDGGFLNE